jgi:acetylornithine deacetylase/succinyl-diaminopimelate desuccinylase-like protein
MKVRAAIGSALALFATGILAGELPPEHPWHEQARAMLEHLVNVPSVKGRGRVPELANWLAEQYRAHGFPAEDIKVLPYGETAAFVARWRASGESQARPIMLMSHLDVVEALPEDWKEAQPFQFSEKNGYFYGRGTDDVKQGVAATTIALFELKAAGFAPTRDIVVFYTGDEETEGEGAHLGATKWHDLLDVEFGLNSDAGGGNRSPDGHFISYTLQTAEKTYASYTFTARNRGGHSSLPRPDNAIYELADALHRLAVYRFEPALNETTRAYFTERQKTETGPLGDAMRAWLANPADGKAADFIEASETEIGYTRTRCVATMLRGGHADNALPQMAEATVNCRIMPGVSPDAIRDELQHVVDDSAIEVRRIDRFPSTPESPLRPDVVHAYTAAVRALHPDTPVVPEMSAGGSDGSFFRAAGIPVYGVDGSWVVGPEDYRAHGQDERLPVKALGDDVDHWVLMLRELAGPHR